MKHRKINEQITAIFSKLIAEDDPARLMPLFYRLAREHEQAFSNVSTWLFKIYCYRFKVKPLLTLATWLAYIADEFSYFAKNEWIYKIAKDD